MTTREESADLYATEYAKHTIGGIECVDYKIYNAFMAGMRWSDNHPINKLRECDKNFLALNYSNFNINTIEEMLAMNGCWANRTVIYNFRNRSKLHRFTKKHRDYRK